MFIAMDTFLDWARFNRTTYEKVDIERGARSLQKLRTAEVTHSQDALAILMLGRRLLMPLSPPRAPYPFFGIR